jgi:hypothetical protein
MEKALIKAYTDDGIGETSIKKYIRELKHLAGTKKLTQLDFLWDEDAVRERLLKTYKNKEASDNTIKNRLTTILATLRVAEMADCIPGYKKLHDEYNKKLKNVEDTGDKNEKQKEYYMTKEEVAEKTKSLKEKTVGAKAGFTQHQNYMIWCLFTKITPRRNLDYWLMDVVEGDVDWKTLPEERNYLMMKEKLLVFNQHKNTRYAKEKGVVEKISLAGNDEMMKIITDYLEFVPKPKAPEIHKHLLCHKNGSRWEASDHISDELKKISGKKYFGTNALRHIIAEHNAPARQQLDAMKKEAEEAGHALNTHMFVYIKKTTL